MPWRLRLRLALGRRLAPSSQQALVAWAGVAGLLGGLASAAFRALLVPLQLLFTGHSGGLVAAAQMLPPWARLAAPTAGGLLAGAVLMLAARRPRDRPATDFMEAIVVGDGAMPPGPILVRCLSALMSIASGGALGREGPMVQLSAMGASAMARRLRLSPPQVRLLVACGVAAGLASAYRAPFAGALFVAEVVLGTLAMESLGPLLCAAVAATLVAQYTGGTGPLYAVGEGAAPGALDLVAAPVLGLACGALGPAFLATLSQVRRAFVQLAPSAVPRLGLGGLIVGALSMAVPEVWGNGYSLVVQLLHEPGPAGAISLVLAAKVLAVLATVGSGAVGGVFTPTLVMGAGVGALLGRALHLTLDAPLAAAGAHALVGMGAMLAATTHAPLMAIMMIFEMTHDYAMVMPLMLACMVASTAARAWRPASIYTEGLAPVGRLQAGGPAPAQRLSVAAAMRPGARCVAPAAPFAEVAAALAASGVQAVFVRDAKPGAPPVGVVALADVAGVLDDPPPGALVRALDIMRPLPAPLLRPGQPLWEAARLLSERGHEVLPVCAADGSHTLLGTLSRADVLLVLAQAGGAGLGAG